MPNTRTNPALGAFARAALREIAAHGWTLVSCAGGVVTVEHPSFGRLDFDNDSYAAPRVTHNWREGFYADALFSAETSTDDGEFEREMGAQFGADAAEFVPVYDRHAAYRVDPTEPERVEILTPSEVAALGADERTDFDSEEAIAALIAGSADPDAQDADDDNAGDDTDDDTE